MTVLLEPGEVEELERIANHATAERPEGQPPIRGDEQQPHSYAQCGRGWILTYYHATPGCGYGMVMTTEHIGCDHEFKVKPHRRIGFL